MPGTKRPWDEEVESKADKPEEGEGSGGEGDEEGEGTEVYGSDIKKIKEQRIKELAALLNQKK